VRFRAILEKRAHVDVLELLPSDVVGEVVDTGRALRRLIHELEGELDCALPPTAATEKMTLEEWFRVVARNAAAPEPAARHVTRVGLPIPASSPLPVEPFGRYVSPVCGARRPTVGR
jgi:hypothetical protein